MRTHSSSRLIVMVAILIGQAAAASAQSFDWAVQAGGPCGFPCSGSFHQGTAIAVDADGNSLVTGRINGVATFGRGEPNETVLTSEGVNLFVAKYDVQGSLRWVRHTLGDPQGLAIAVDAAGNSYVAGGFRFRAAFPGTPLFGPASGLGDFFIAKYDAEGNFVWARQGGVDFVPSLPGSAASALAIAVDSAGNLRLTGAFGTPSGALGGFYAASYDANGNREWIRIAGDDVSSGSAAGTGISIDAAGNAYVIGDLSGTVTFGLGEPTQATLVGSSLFTSDFFVAKYDVNGAFVWARRTGDLGDDHGTAIATDAAGNVHITGTIDGTVTFGADEPAETTFTTISNDMFVARYDSSGSLQWARHVPGLGVGGGAAIALDGSGGIHVGGAFVASLTFGQGEATETVLSVDPGGSTNPFVAKYNSNGAFAWARSATGALAAVAFGVAAHSTGTSITGYFSDLGTASLTFGAGEPSATTLTTTFGQEIFVARYTNGTPLPPPNLQIAAIKAPASAAPGAAISVSDTTRNAGTGGAGDTTTRLWLSTNKTLGPGDTELGARSVPALAAGARHTVTTEVTLPAAAPGAYFLLVQADADDDALEGNEADNIKAKAIVIGPDLTITSMVFDPVSPTSSAPTTITLTVKNLGGEGAGASVTRLYRSANGKLDGSDTLLAELSLGALAAGDTATQSTTLTLPAGTYYVLAICDAATAVIEAKETNNLKKVLKAVP